VGSIHVVSSSRTAHFSLLGLHFSRPCVNAAAGLLLGLALIGLAVFGLGVRAALAEAVANQRFLRSIGARRPRPHDDLLVFDDAEVQAFCAGLLHPQIYVSTGALQALSGPELDVVLAHERHHRQRLDPLRIALGRVLSRALFFLPVVALLHKRYCAMAELAADDTAMAGHPGGSHALASALLAVAAGRQPETAVGIAPERVDQMMGRAPDWPLPAAVVGAGLAASALIAALSWQLAQLASVRSSLSLPLLSARPCVVVLALVPSLLATLAVAHLRRWPPPPADGD
jgi:hypothetical protein